jgi:hypothetical protein
VLWSAASTGDEINTWKVLVAKPGQRKRVEDGGRKGVAWSPKALVNTVMNFSVLYQPANFLST